MSSSNTADDSHEAMTLAECYAMTVHFSLNLNPAIAAAVQRIMSGRSNYDKKISGYRNQTLEECVAGPRRLPATPRRGSPRLFNGSWVAAATTTKRSADTERKR